MILTIILIFLILVSPQQVTHINLITSLNIWNVGQGQWITWSEPDKCFHFDAGGEKIPWSKIINLCDKKNNYIFLSHKDKDHSQWINRLFQIWPKNTCLIRPLTQNPDFILKTTAPYCKNDFLTQDIQRLIPPAKKYLKNRNYYSEISRFKKFLFPGDSIKNAEKWWAQKLTSRSKIKLLVLGHHGSKTSTSENLLNRLPALIQCISSARKAKYGHPHPETILQLKIKKCPHLNTEKWGHIHFIYTDGILNPNP
jgi:competence protein ComEC